MKFSILFNSRFVALLMSGGLALMSASSQAAIDGETGTLNGTTRSFSFYTQQFNIPAPDGDSIPTWGFGIVGNNAQYPGPTLIVNQGETVEITLSNNLPLPVSIVFPGQSSLSAIGGTPGLITQEAPALTPGNTVIYRFDATEPGTYLYESGTHQDLEQEMGLFGAIIVRPIGFSNTNLVPNTIDPAVVTRRDPNQNAYGVGTNTDFDYEYLFVLSEMDANFHHKVGGGQLNVVDNSAYNDVLWFINGRNGPDTLSAAGQNLYTPNQPYNIIPKTHPGEKVLIRLIGAGRKAHPFHHHGANSCIIAQDGSMLSSNGLTADLCRSDYTIQTNPGRTYDAIWTWTGENLGWDLYGINDVHNDDTNVPLAVLDPLPPLGTGTNNHLCNGQNHATNAIDPVTFEDCNDHNKDVPVDIPNNQDLILGGFWSGSPLLGASGNLPPGEGGLNANAAFTFIWHSHTEKELANNDIYPGGLMTFMFVEPYYIEDPLTPGTLIFNEIPRVGIVDGIVQ